MERFLQKRCLYFAPVISIYYTSFIRISENKKGPETGPFVIFIVICIFQKIVFAIQKQSRSDQFHFS